MHFLSEGELIKWPHSYRPVYLTRLYSCNLQLHHIDVDLLLTLTLQHLKSFTPLTDCTEHVFQNGSMEVNSLSQHWFWKLLWELRNSPFCVGLRWPHPTQHLVGWLWLELVAPQSEVCCALHYVEADERSHADHCCPLPCLVMLSPGSLFPLHQLHMQMER